MDTFNDDNKIIESIRKGDEKTLKMLYVRYHKEAIAFLKNYAPIAEQEVDDMFNMAMVIFYEKIISGNLVLSASIRTYLFAIMKNLLIKKYDTKPIDISYKDNLESLLSESIEPMEQTIIRQELAALTKSAISELSERCANLLSLYYYKQYSIDAITQKMRFSSENSTRVALLKCRDRLMSIIESNPKYKELLRNRA